MAQPPKIGQKGFCIQNLRMYLSFQVKKTIGKSDNCLPRYLQYKHCTTFFKHPVLSRLFWEYCNDTASRKLNLNLNQSKNHELKR